MVVLASAIISKQSDKILISRQFVEMTRSRIEGLLTTFTKLVTQDKQHTFIETDSVRYVYQALMDTLYCVLITTKASNILEDLETLRLFVRVINEYASTSAKTSDEQAILDNSFTLLFAFDEIVALGYRENVNMSQLRTFIEMDSHEERVFTAVRQTQEREAKQKMREKVKELAKSQRTQHLQRSTMARTLPSPTRLSNVDKPEPTVGDKAIGGINVTSQSIIRSKGPSRALKLGSKFNQNSMLSQAVQLENELKQEEPLPPVEVEDTQIELNDA